MPLISFISAASSFTVRPEMTPTLNLPFSFSRHPPTITSQSQPTWRLLMYFEECYFSSAPRIYSRCEQGGGQLSRGTLHCANKNTFTHCRYPVQHAHPAKYNQRLIVVVVVMLLVLCVCVRVLVGVQWQEKTGGGVMMKSKRGGKRGMCLQRKYIYIYFLPVAIFKWCLVSIHHVCVFASFFFVRSFFH